MEIEHKDKQWIECLLGMSNRPHYKSCFVLAYTSAQFNLKYLSQGSTSASLIDSIEDVYMFNIGDFSIMTAVTNYMISLDILGCCFTKRGCPIPDNINGVDIILHAFSSLNDEEIDAIKALRNTVAHNFGLATDNSPKRNKSGKHYKFALEPKCDSLISFPARLWNDSMGNRYDDKSNESNTIIGVESLSKLVYDVYQNVINAYKTGQLVLVVHSINELRARFILQVA